MERARGIAPGHGDVAELERQARRLEERLEVERLLDEAEALARSDAWAEALPAYSRALSLQPENGDARDGFRRAARVSELSAQIAAHLRAPQRLASANVASEARALVERSLPLHESSPSLAERSRRLLDALSLYQAEVAVRVISDGRTAVAVRGVGRIGVAKDRTVRLKPGAYTFEGVREGYRSKLVRVTVPPRAPGVEVTVVCDERI